MTIHCSIQSILYSHRFLTDYHLPLHEQSTSVPLPFCGTVRSYQHTRPVIAPVRPDTFIPCTILEEVHPMAAAHSVEPIAVIPVTVEVLLNTFAMFSIALPLAMVSRPGCGCELTFAMFLPMPPEALVSAVLGGECAHAMTAIAMERALVALAGCGTVESALAMAQTAAKFSLVVGLAIQFLMREAKGLSAGV